MVEDEDKVTINIEEEMDVKTAEKFINYYKLEERMNRMKEIKEKIKEKIKNIHEKSI